MDKIIAYLIQAQQGTGGGLKGDMLGFVAFRVEGVANKRMPFVGCAK